VAIAVATVDPNELHASRFPQYDAYATMIAFASLRNEPNLSSTPAHSTRSAILQLRW
jgi:hypothetical protein